ncbi:MAG: SGNH/GDSL hydrolase family protein [Limnospira sp. PMC 1291.21]|uniref:SGNH/GDSL hydrolase family protein n=1 Tax=unclassified Limnospira TaxID=2642885 RepID=UPI0028E0B33F|nr:MULTISPECIES: SGNH/GDSL hydrolase family protein [unclassified Limnospira]MDT9180480.1 SGNH/GDSL hydrolase family protein [Limnospira sp. PMC 1238.20]MDT9195780.1 SGNH/GDSL hydrolase family protein [Limnospira sp. PMC 1245.20]MDT9205399.1 SGNH/GDSL hydrolase family protein [Limnospira sp. PMC 1243.20]MDT9211189.1 SGNH/GDSL hydrolase family protein [Limnospira sp. PMC 1252.20]MDT9216268.1 SGNH/GDSL hydrolase family protein [Limnospira sp. PMC 1256.20]
MLSDIITQNRLDLGLGTFGDDVIIISELPPEQLTRFSASPLTEAIALLEGDDYIINDDPEGRILLGNQGNDTLIGHSGNDTIYGGQGNDLIIGGSGNNILSGDRGLDTLTGGDGINEFILSQSSADQDLITDFKPGIDKLRLFRGATFSDLDIEQSDSSTVIEFNGETLVTLNNVSANSLTIDDFIEALHFEEIYIFGDSLSDTGNAFIASEGQVLAGLPYFQGRASNGLLWVDYLGDKLSLNPVNFSEQSPSNEGINFAFFGANTSGLNTTEPGLFPGLENQLQAFIAPLLASGQTANPNALYTLWVGANDYLAGRQTDGTIPVNNLTEAVTSLYQFGARDFLMLNLPPLGELPVARFNPLDPVDPVNSFDAEELNRLSAEHNQGLREAVDQLNQNLPGANVSLFDVGGLFEDAIANPEQFGLTNVTDSSISFILGTIADNPEQYLFWDILHPTTTTHQIIASDVYEQLLIDYQ